MINGKWLLIKALRCLLKICTRKAI